MVPKRLRRPLSVLAGASLLVSLGACTPEVEPTEPTVTETKVEYDAAGLMPSVQTRTTHAGDSRVDLGVSAVLVSEGTAYVRLTVEALGDDVAEGGAEGAEDGADESAVGAGGSEDGAEQEPVAWSDFLPTRTSTMAQGPGLPIRLLDLARSQVHDSTTLDRPDADLVVGEYAVATFPAGNLAEGDAVTLMVDPVGFFLDLPVVTGVQPPPRGKKVQDQLPTVDRDDFVSDMVKLELAWDESESTVVERDTTTITLDSDYLFAANSADLGADAGPMLAGVADRLATMPGGQLTITAHTDDTGEDAYNQELSQRRANAVMGELFNLTDLGRFETSAVGKGESEPRVVGISAQARLANRRVEISVTTSADAAPPDQDQSRSVEAPGEKPETQPDVPLEPTGVVGDGVAGVEVKTPANGGPGAKDGRIQVRVPQVLRVDGWLLGEVEVEVLSGEPVLSELLSVNPERVDSLWGISLLLPDGIMVLDGEGAVPTAAYRVAGTEVRSTLVPKSHAIKPEAGHTVVLPMVWPDTGADMLTLTTERGARGTDLSVQFRLTDIPVSDARQ